jgi:UDPglucose 6-dehydrogenase
MNVAIIGAGYVGLTTAVALAYLGHDVVCIDVDEVKVERLRAGQSPIFEPGLESLLQRSRARLTFHLASAPPPRGVDVFIIAVGTPEQPDGAPDLRYVRSAAAYVAEALDERFAVVVNKSTVPIGSGNWVESLVRDALGNRRDRQFAVASNPEFLREGSALFDTLYPDRIVVGADDPRATERMLELYRPILDQSFEAPPEIARPRDLGKIAFLTTALSSAELIKYSANAFLALKISFINEIAELAERVGADVTQVAEGIGLDQRIGKRFLQAGLGWGGSCFGKDTSALVTTAREYGLAMPIVQAARSVNQRQRDRLIEKLQQELKILNGRTIGMLGLAFKPDTDDLRDAPALDLAQRLLKRGAKVRTHDPVAMPRTRAERGDLAVLYCDAAEDVADGADALVLATEWPVYKTLRWDRIHAAMRGPRVIIDGRNVLPREELESMGFRYVGMGR